MPKPSWGLKVPFFLLTILLMSTSIAQGTQLYINELLDGNPPPQVLKEGPIVRVIQPGVPKPVVEELEFVEGLEEQNIVDLELDIEIPLAEPGPRSPRKVALTFDDGPDAYYTSTILDILQAEDVLATFFVVGDYVERYPELLQRMFSDGHVIANHSSTHKDLGLLTNEDIVDVELGPTSKLIEGLTGYYPMIMRPPYGSLRPDSVHYLKDAGWRIVRWSLDTFDWDSRRNQPEQIITRIQEQHHNRAIVLMHCNGPATTRVLPEIIKTLRDLGYEFVTVTQL